MNMIVDIKKQLIEKIPEAVGVTDSVHLLILDPSTGSRVDYYSRN